MYLVYHLGRKTGFKSAGLDWGADVLSLNHFIEFISKFYTIVIHMLLPNNPKQWIKKTSTLKTITIDLSISTTVRRYS